MTRKKFEEYKALLSVVAVSDDRKKVLYGVHDLLWEDPREYNPEAWSMGGTPPPAEKDWYLHRLLTHASRSMPASLDSFARRHCKDFNKGYQAEAAILWKGTVEVYRVSFRYKYSHTYDMTTVLKYELLPLEESTEAKALLALAKLLVAKRDSLSLYQEMGSALLFGALGGDIRPKKEAIADAGRDCGCDQEG